ncbi:glycosyltransferase family 4 protein [Clostridium sp. DJ247]|uniref:glycosyltransferase family 4 protein n=1 Tax=Clostridium sp. DJ247 TaxID=2726188 RepID=UPI001623FA7E|nr:glycosyltransferase family 4 protein [Clostridium sp. DJ247]MBC2579472.1 glycosyltransferase [Clostridium sp. DJ247]
MRILMLSWEYPPKNIGGLSNHVFYLSRALSRMGHEVHVVTCEEGAAPIEENNYGVIVHRVTPYKVYTDDFTKWVMHLNFSMIEEATRIITNSEKFDLIHAHDWLSAFAAKSLKWSFKIPMVATIHATEHGRNRGIKTDIQRYISSTEWVLTYEAWKVVACSNYMRQQVNELFESPWEKIWVIPNGVDPEKFTFGFDWINFRRNFAKDNEKIVFYIGRHVFEKGIHVLVDASQEIVNRYNDTKFVIAGTGPMTEELKNKVRERSLESKFLFTGYMNDETRDKLYRVANVAVFPSLYEPFGIVALEAMAAGCPVVVSNTGGFNEIIEHRGNGLKAVAGSTESIIDNVSELLFNDNLARTVKENAINTIYAKYTWEKVAEITSNMYELVKTEAKGTEWEIKEHRQIREEMKNQLRNELEEQVIENLRSELKYSVEKELEEKLTDKVQSELADKLKSKVEEDLRIELNDKVIQDLTKEFKSKIDVNKCTVDNIAAKTIETSDYILENKELITDDIEKNVKIELLTESREITSDEIESKEITNDEKECNVTDGDKTDSSVLDAKEDVHEEHKSKVKSLAIEAGSASINVTGKIEVKPGRRKRVTAKKIK